MKLPTHDPITRLSAAFRWLLPQLTFVLLALLAYQCATGKIHITITGQEPPTAVGHP